MTTETFIEIMNSGEKILCGSDVHQYMGKLSQEAMKSWFKVARTTIGPINAPSAI